MIDQSIFENYARERKQIASQEEARKKNGNFQKSYEEIHYAVCEAEVPTVIRVLGAPIDTNVDETTARTVTISMVIGDSGKKFRVVRDPKVKDDVFSKIISTVTKAKWDKDGNKTFPVQDEHPEVYNIVMKNGVPSTDPKYKFDKGWNGSTVITFNCINRADMDWHKANKHTALICKSYNNGFAEDGLSAYSTRDLFDKLIGTYGSWEQYDIGITRHKQMKGAYDIYNVSRTPEFINDDAIRETIVEGKLTEEEDSWTRYDLSKIFKPTSATKIYNNLKGTIAKIDLALGTHFLEELEAQSKKELEEWEKDKPKEEEKPVVKEAVAPKAESFYDEEEEPIAVPKPVVRRASATASAEEEWKKFPYADAIPSHLRSACKKAYKNADGNWTGEWDESVPTACCQCGCESPLEATQCCGCGADFE